MSYETADYSLEYYRYECEDVNAELQTVAA